MFDWQFDILGLRIRTFMAGPLVKGHEDWEQMWEYVVFILWRHLPVPDCASWTLGSTLITVAATHWHKLNETKYKFVRHWASWVKYLKKNIIATMENMNNRPVDDTKVKYLKMKEQIITLNLVPMVSIGKEGTRSHGLLGNEVTRSRWERGWRWDPGNDVEVGVKQTGVCMLQRKNENG